MRAIFVAMIIAGFGLALGYPWYMRHFTGSEIGRWVILENPASGFITKEVPLQESDGPVRIFVDATPLPGYVPVERRSVIRLAVSRDGFPVLSERLDFVAKSSSMNVDRPQNGDVLRQSAGDIDPVIKGNYSFRTVKGDIDGLRLSKAELVLRRGAEEADETITTIGLIMGVMGVYALMRTRLRRRRPEARH